MNTANKHARPHVLTVMMVLHTNINLVYKAVIGVQDFFPLFYVKMQLILYLIKIQALLCGCIK